MQALEVSRDQVDELYAWLIRAPRHNSITMLGYKEIEARHWSSWSMVFAAPNFDNRALFLNYSLQGTFKSKGMKAEATEKMLMELACTCTAMTS